MSKENEFGQYEYKVQEKVTTAKIEHDLQTCHTNNLLTFLMMLPCVAAFDGILIWMAFEMWDNTTGLLIYFIVLYAALGFLNIFVIGGIVYSIYMMLSGYKKFSVAIDRFRGIKTVVKCRNKKYRTHYYLMFSKYGMIEFSPKLEYYTWSEYYRMWGDGIDDSSHIGDRFFLIMRGKKIVYFYNDRMFDLSETLKEHRLITIDEKSNKSEYTLNGETQNDS